jgi:AcrR family transcriptional regulator
LTGTRKGLIYLPTSTFFNLPEVKRERIFAAAVAEFAERPFSQASINSIIKKAGISRGSFYQYFADKADLYTHVITRITAEKLDVFAEYTLPATDDGFFANTLASLPAVFAWAERRPDYNRIGFLLSQDSTDFAQSLFRQIDGSRAFILSMLRRDRDRGLIRADADLEMTVDLFVYTSVYWIQEYYSVGAESVTQKLRTFLDILKNGIGGDPRDRDHSGGGKTFPALHRRRRTRLRLKRRHLHAHEG